MGQILKRRFEIKSGPNQSSWIWGGRRVGKSYWLRQHFQDSIYIDLLKTDVFAEYVSKPSLLRERYSETKKIIVIDEIQKAPALLDEVHWLIENKGVQFILTGSSARKLKRGQANLLAGRARRYEMRPLTYFEVEPFDIESVMVTGLLPPFYLSDDPISDLRSYVSDYLKEEIASEALVQNIPAFSEFLKIAAITSSELINYTNVARESGVSAKVVRSYFQILEDTLLGFRLPPWVKSKNRRMIETEKFYLFDVGLTNYLLGRKPRMGTPEFGKSFEQLILMELVAYKAYRNPELPIHFWRTSTKQEIDFILGDMQVAVEVKGSKRVQEIDLSPLKSLNEEWKQTERVVVCLETEERISNGIQILPIKNFLQKLWNGKFGI